MHDDCPICGKTIDGDGYVCNVYGQPFTVVGEPRPAREWAELILDEVESYGGEATDLRAEWDGMSPEEQEEYGGEIADDVLGYLPEDVHAVTTEEGWLLIWDCRKEVGT